MKTAFSFEEVNEILNKQQCRVVNLLDGLIAIWDSQTQMYGIYQKLPHLCKWKLEMTVLSLETITLREDTTC